MRTTATRQTVLKAIENVNNKHGYSIQINNDSQKGKWYNFTIRSEKSGISGARTTTTGRNMVSASWHAHGYVFDEILKIEPDTVIKSLDKTIDKNGGNWEDMNIGSHSNPVMMSQTSIL